MAFTCSGIRYPCFESLGLDITSAILNRFKMATTYLLFFLSIERIVRMIDSPTIQFVSNIFTNSELFDFLV